jgi:hypothetical protein
MAVQKLFHGGISGSGGNNGILSHAEQARVCSGLCFNHFV